MNADRFLIKVEKSSGRAHSSDYTWAATVRDLAEHNLYFYGNSADEVLLKVLTYMVEEKP